MSQPRMLPLTLLGLCLFATTAHAAIQIASFDTLTNDRFANDGTFIASSFDLSGLALVDTAQSSFSGDDGGRWIAMVSPNVFVTAHHFFPNNGNTVTFYSTNDPTGPTTTRQIESSERIGTSDIRIGRLDTPLGSDYSYFDFATADVTDIPSLIASGYVTDAYVVGRSPTNFAVDQDIAIGRNVIDLFFSPAQTGTPDPAIGATINDPGDTNHVAFEADLRIGDSGAPLLVNEGGALTIVGINWFISDPAGDFFGASYLGNYDEEIQTYIDTHAPVPEPSAYALLLGLSALVSLLMIRRSHKQST